MSIPEVLMAFSDGALGLVDTGSDQAQLVVGTSSAGTANTLYAFGDLDTLRSTAGYGPAPEYIARGLSQPGHGTFYFLKANPTTAGASSAVTAVGTSPAMSLSVGGAFDDYEGAVKVIVGGAVGTATFQYSLDNGITWSNTITTAATYPIPNSGLTLAFAAGTYVAGDSYSWTSTAPYYSTTDLAAALTAALADPREWGTCHILGAPGGVDDATKATNCAAVFAALDAQMQAAAAAFRFSRAVMSAPDVADSALVTAFGSLSSANGRVSVGAGYSRPVSPISGRAHKRSASWSAAERMASVPIHEDIGWVGRGPLSGMNAILRDERKTPGLDAARFITLRTIVGKQGFYVTNPNTMAPTGSDYSLGQYVAVANLLAKTVRNGMLFYLNASVRVNDVGEANAGGIFELDARAIEADVGGQAKAALVDAQHVTSTTVQINRTDNILSTKKLRVSARCVPLAYLKEIDVTLGFTNPALQIAA